MHVGLILCFQDYNLSSWQIALNAAAGGGPSQLWATELTHGELSSNNSLTGVRFDNLAPLYANATAATNLTLSQVRWAAHMHPAPGCPWLPLAAPGLHGSCHDGLP